jgi:Ca2+-binding RTX toxin-like protein
MFRQRLISAATVPLVEMLEGRRLLSATLVADEGQVDDGSEVKDTSDPGDAPLKTADPAADGQDPIIYYTLTAKDGVDAGDDAGSSDNPDDSPIKGADDGGDAQPTADPGQIIYYATGAEQAQAPAPTLANGVLTVTGTQQNDHIFFYLKQGDASRLIVKVNGTATAFSVADITSVKVEGLGGNDHIIVRQKGGAITLPFSIDAGAGDDKVIGGSGDDVIIGGTGRDLLSGNGGNDSIAGDAGDDLLCGGAGGDQLNGGDGKDRLRGGLGDDALNGGGGNDVLVGGLGSDIEDGGAGHDKIRGGRGADRNVDAADTMINADKADGRLGAGRFMRPIWWSDEGDTGGQPTGMLTAIWWDPNADDAGSGDDTSPTGQTTTNDNPDGADTHPGFMMRPIDSVDDGSSDGSVNLY